MDRDGQDEKRQDGQDLVGGEGNLGGQERITAKEDSSDAGTVRAQEAVPALRARLNRSLLAKRHPAPDWVRALNDDEGVSPGQVDSLYYRLTHSLARLTAGAQLMLAPTGLLWTSLNTRGLGGRRRGHFLQKLLAKTLADLEQGRLQEQIANAAAEVGVEGDKATRLVQSLCREALKIYAEGKVASSETLIDKARRRAKLSEEQAQDLLAVLASSITR